MHVLREKNLPDPLDLATLRVVSRGMREAVDATGLQFKELDEDTATNLGCLTTLRRLQRRGLPKCEFSLCKAAARSGQLEELKLLRAENFPWDEWTCTFAAESGHLKVLQWLRANGCPWDMQTLMCAQDAGHLDVATWLEENGIENVMW